ncbi:hypothetical protein I7I50_08429 [Histoplasma capsulatum G186AR]|uniref:Uncharacterized protein n=1 Tax=Ajellomyces capsulatus TaxID=5037 RepID=A0A8H7YNH5_AJECA|nr:hypothetical protein I7I52_05944 [Histoplasma capsulatum]QSS73596.1 hypothetical protein I7I50_08429 [Histoplasma capsulatum G186AR]
MSTYPCQNLASMSCRRRGWKMPQIGPCPALACILFRFEARFLFAPRRNTECPAGFSCDRQQTQSVVVPPGRILYSDSITRNRRARFLAITVLIYLGRCMGTVGYMLSRPALFLR